MLAKFVDEGPPIPGLKEELHMGMTVEVGLALLNVYLVAILAYYNELALADLLLRR